MNKVLLATLVIFASLNSLADEAAYFEYSARQIALKAARLETEQREIREAKARNDAEMERRYNLAIGILAENLKTSVGNSEFYPLSASSDATMYSTLLNGYACKASIIIEAEIRCITEDLIEKKFEIDLSSRKVTP
jgi:hypothetical protein